MYENVKTVPCISEGKKSIALFTTTDIPLHYIQTEQKTHGANTSVSADISTYMSSGAISVRRRFHAERAAACSDANSADTTGTVPFPFKYDPEKIVSSDAIN
jgi:hypothetical protein